jgi:hypothetical protein
MELTDQRSERRRSKWHKINPRPIAVLGPNPIRTGHLARICDEAVEIQFLERHDREVFSFSELAVLIPASSSAYLSGRIRVETIYCRISGVNGNGAKPQNGNSADSKMRKCIISLNNMEPNKKKLLITACIKFNIR